MGNEVPPSDLDLPDEVKESIDWDSSSVRKQFAQRLSDEIENCTWSDSPETMAANSPRRELSRDRAVSIIEKNLRRAVEADSSGRASLRGLINFQSTWEFVTGEPWKKSLERVAVEYHENNIYEVARWLTE